MTEKVVDENAYAELVGKAMEKQFEITVTVTKCYSLTISVERDEIDEDDEDWESVAEEKAEYAAESETWGHDGVELDYEETYDVSIENTNEI